MKPPTLGSLNQFDQLMVDDMDSDMDTDSMLVDLNVQNSRGPQPAELGAPEVCLIPCKSEPINQKPKEGVKE